MKDICAMTPESEFYVAHSDTDTVLHGYDLCNGMRVLIESSLFRGPDRDTNNPYDITRRDKCNNWCEVSNFNHRNEVISFIGKYADGTMRVHQYAASYFWIVKIDSLPANL